MTKTNTGDDNTLPLANAGTTPQTPPPFSEPPKRSMLKVLPLALLLMFSGGVIGMYFQPPLLRTFYALTGLQPGGGTQTPIAQAIEIITTHEEIALVSEGDVVALGRLIPKGDVVTVATPFGAGDARISVIKVEVGEQVVTGQILAELDNLGQLQGTVNSVRAVLDVRVATLAQVEQSIEASLQEARASLARIETTAEVTQSELSRATTLLEHDAIPRAEFDVAQARAIESALDVERARTTLSRFETQSGLPQTDIAVAEANLNAAKVDLARAEQDLNKAYILAPADGTVLDIH
ncbi:MAG: HlyD family secretion protein, partial [Alphaproteobacteria bacterium]